MFTKEQLANWRELGFEFDDFYDAVAVDKKEEIPTPIEIKEDKLSEEDFYNEVEIEFVKYLFKIRNANKDKQKVVYERFSGPFGGVKRERVFIAGKIFPILNMKFSGKDADASIITKKSLNLKEKVLLFGDKDSSLYSPGYISIGNDDIMIFVPKPYSEVDYLGLMYDFLTNGKLTAHTIGGEFPDYETYKLALREKAKALKNWKGEDGCWLIEDRAENKERWWNGYDYIVKNKVRGRLAPFKQIYDFYDAVDGWLFRLGHKVKWCKGAKKLVGALANSPVLIGGLEGGSNVISNDIEVILNELNLGICDYAIIKFHELIYGKYATTPLTGDDAYNWDVAFVTHEQQVVAPPIYNKTSAKTIATYQDMADKKVLGGTHGAGSYILNTVTPAFDDFNPPAKVTDMYFRTDLPLLMLYLDIHKPSINTKPLKKYLTANGTVNEECKEIIRPYVV